MDWVVTWTEIKDQLPFLFRYSVNVLACFGIAFIVCGIVEMRNKGAFPFLESLCRSIGDPLAVFGVLLAGCSIYVEAEHPTRPEKISKYFTAPILILGCLVVLAVIWQRRKISPAIINGLVMIGIAACLLRLQPNPYFLP